MPNYHSNTVYIRRKDVGWLKIELREADKSAGSDEVVRAGSFCIMSFSKLRCFVKCEMNKRPEHLLLLLKSTAPV